VEKIFQKYESEIKTHIKINKDMTTTIENLNKKVDDLYEKNNTYYTIIKKLEEDNANSGKRLEEIKIIETFTLMSVLLLIRVQVTKNLKSWQWMLLEIQI